MSLFLPSPLGIATGHAPAVGVHYLAATLHHPPLRIYYPASCQDSASEVGYFQDTSAAFFLQGYWSVFWSRRSKQSPIFRLGLLATKVLSYFFTLNWLKVPNVYENAPLLSPNNTTKYPMILFSHGLTGSGQENSILLSAWARQGFVVVAVHHCDGSSGRVCLPNGQDRWYDPGPLLSHYDKEFRPKQVEQRVHELVQAYKWLTKQGQDNTTTTTNNALLKQLSTVTDGDKVVVAGFSYGAATAALLAAKGTLSPQMIGTILLDGWFYIDVAQSANVEFEFPQLAFEDSAKPFLSRIPALFINSEQFAHYPKLRDTTRKLAQRYQSHQLHVLPATRHNNFVDVIFWCPSWLLRRLKVIDSGDPRQAYRDMVNSTCEFLRFLTLDPSY